jgi:hypothetical protein
MILMGIAPRLAASIAATCGLALTTLFSFTSCGPVVDPVVEPSLRYKSDAQGCANFTIYKWNESMTEALVIDGLKDELKLSTASRTFRLDSVPEALLSVRVDRYTRTTLSPYCTDVRNPDQESPRVWRATSGTVTITLDRDSVVSNDLYKVTVKLRDVHFKNGTAEVVLTEENFNDVTVGWLPG